MFGSGSIAGDQFAQNAYLHNVHGNLPASPTSEAGKGCKCAMISLPLGLIAIAIFFAALFKQSGIKITRPQLIFKDVQRAMTSSVVVATVAFLLFRIGL
jgi:hypothetical protein